MDGYRHKGHHEAGGNLMAFITQVNKRRMI